MNVTDKVRNVKTRVAGVIMEIDGDEAEIRTFDEVPATHKCRVKDLEELNEAEYGLVLKIVTARAAKKAADDLAKKAASDAAAAEDEIVEYLRQNRLESTKAYDGLGLVAIDGMKTMASITEENKEKAYADLRAIGRGEIIKESVNAATLSSIVAEMMDKGEKVPESISYFLKPKLSVRKK